jgi:signal peptidase
MSTTTTDELTPRRAASGEPVAAPKIRPWRRAASWAMTVVLVALLGLGVVLAVIPALNRGTALTVLTGSMQPTIKAGDIAVVFAVDSFDDIEIGDIVTFMPWPDDPTLLTHRAVAWGIGADGEKVLIARGDANSANDDPIKEGQLRAKFAYKVPWLGHVLQYSDFGKPALIGVVSVALLAYAVFALATSFRRK